MSEWLPLTEVASRAGLSDRAVAWRDAQALDRAAFLREVGRWQAAFAAQSGQRFALYIEDPFDFAAALYGAWHAGKTPYLPGDAQPATIERLTRLVDGLAGDLPGGMRPADEPAPQPTRSLDLVDTRVVMFTSGSSGEPAALEKKLAQLDAEIHTQHAAFGTRWARHADLSVYATVSHQHIYGLLFLVLWPLAAGRRFVTRRLAYAEEMAARLGPAPSLLVSSPAHLKRLPESIDWTLARRGLQAVLSSGGPLPPEAALQAAQCFGAAPIEIFGSSETGGIAWRQRTVHADRWQPLPQVEWRIDDGLLAVRSPYLPDAQWWLTADRVRADADGSFVMLGRADRIVKIEEKRVSLSAIERRLAESPLLADARVLALAAGTGLRVAAVVVLSDAGRAALAAQGRRAFNEALRAWLAGSVERIALPRRWRHVAALPVNAQGKTTEAALAALFDDDMPSVQWIECGATEARAEFSVEAGDAAFDGHFPAAAILPGVIQLDWAIRCGRDCFALAAPVAGLEVLKFQQPVLPGTKLTLALHWKPETRAMTFRITSTAGVHASGRVLFAVSDV
ncbi:AMP-binding protein [Piscinibacter sp.]|jgi:acyl-coenzyme A synthetase/AMP-(fatty) acid ligase/3-hydroxymyristoyl/3-hydroxydecanoyl-(acyl carrier protein) dehydratase|uniref:AMP-binding protein n=1 Tax=Piscinibacter sp. TaxID=1903157 RepID=UPI00355A6EF7